MSPFGAHASRSPRSCPANRPAGRIAPVTFAQTSANSSGRQKKRLKLAQTRSARGSLTSSIRATAVSRRAARSSGTRRRRRSIASCWASVANTDHPPFEHGPSVDARPATEVDRRVSTLAEGSEYLEEHLVRPAVLELVVIAVPIRERHAAPSSDDRHTPVPDLPDEARCFVRD